MIKPKITVITPSYNQGKYLETTILSVIGQNYPNLEYILFDGGSIDNSPKIIKEYKKYFKYLRIHKDKGQASAINEGFGRSTGDIIMWLNSDDYLLPNSLKFISENMGHDRPEILFGNSIHIWEDSARCTGSDVVLANKNLNIKYCDYIIQPSSAINRKALDIVGLLDEKYQCVFDWDFFIRFKEARVTFKSVEEYLSVYRIHGKQKTYLGGQARQKEIRSIYHKYAGENIANSYDWFLRNKKVIEILHTSSERLHSKNSGSKKTIGLKKTESSLVKIAMRFNKFNLNDKQIYQIQRMVF